jgi:hypothetical protein
MATSAPPSASEEQVLMQQEHDAETAHYNVTLVLPWAERLPLQVCALNVFLLKPSCLLSSRSEFPTSLAVLSLCPICAAGLS